MEEPLLRSLVAKYLDAHLNENAVFLGERLVALHPSEQNRLLLATCHVREGQSGVKRAYAILRGATGPENRYLLATCCFKLDKLHEAERVLLADTNVLEKGLTGTILPCLATYLPLAKCLDLVIFALPACRSSLEQHPCPVPHGAAGLYLLGRICQVRTTVSVGAPLCSFYLNERTVSQRACRHSQASIYFSCSLSLDPFLWSSFEALCDMGEVIDVQTCFGKMPDLPPQFHKVRLLTWMGRITVGGILSLSPCSHLRRSDIYSATGSSLPHSAAIWKSTSPSRRPCQRRYQVILLGVVSLLKMSRLSHNPGLLGAQVLLVLHPGLILVQCLLLSSRLTLQGTAGR
jgi:hypothetical protein